MRPFLTALRRQPAEKTAEVFQLINNKFTNMIRYITSTLAVIIAVGAVAFTTPNGNIKHNPKTLSYYFEFTGTHGHEADETLWQEISLSDYNSLNCSGSNQGCKITTSAVVDGSLPFPEREISTVTVNSNSVPQTTMDNIEVKNKP